MRNAVGSKLPFKCNHTLISTQCDASRHCAEAVCWQHAAQEFQHPVAEKCSFSWDKWRLEDMNPVAVQLNVYMRGKNAVKGGLGRAPVSQRREFQSHCCQVVIYLHVYSLSSALHSSWFTQARFHLQTPGLLSPITNTINETFYTLLSFEHTCSNTS